MVGCRGGWLHSCRFYFAALLIKTYFTLKEVFTVLYEGEQKTVLDGLKYYEVFFFFLEVTI